MKISIKHKLTILIIFILIINIAIVNFSTLNGIKAYQQKRYEDILKQSSKTANIYIREKFLKSDIRSYKEFFIENADRLNMELKDIIGYDIELYNINGNILSNKYSLDNKVDKGINKALLNNGLNNNIAYKKMDEYNLEYVAPIYDYNEQIGVMRVIYSFKDQSKFYKDIKSLYIKFGLLSIIIAFVIARMSIMVFVRRIMKIKSSLELVENSEFDSVEAIASNDELGDLSLGIKSMSSQIKTNIEGINSEKEKLKSALSKLRRLEKKQREFISSITHEFKTPITVIKAQLDLARLYDDDKIMAEKARNIVNKELMRLNDMVENILYLSSIEKYDYEFKKTRFKTQEIIEEICSRMTAKASKYGIDIYRELVEAYIYFDKDSFMQVFINIIDNAIKYNKSYGKIYIRSYIELEYIVFEIEDTGIGIPEKAKQRIFDPFFIVDKNRSKRHSGTGLGLAVVKKMLAKQDGSITAMDGSEGSIFIVKIPQVHQG